MKTKLIYILFLWIFFPVVAFASESEGVIYDSSKYAWGEKTGWVNFNPTNGGVHITDQGLTGYAWSENYGWINLAPEKAGVKNDGEGDLSGKAWNDKLGWVDFSGVVVDESGNFSGTAGDGNSDFGRLAFECTDCQVATDWRPQSARDNSGSSDSGKEHEKKGNSSASPKNNFLTNNNGSNQPENINSNDKEDTLKNIVNNTKGANSHLLYWLWLALAILLFLLFWYRRKRKINK